MSPLAAATVSQLRETMNAIVPPDLYPSGVVPVPNPTIAGTGFYPGAAGLYLEERDPAGVDFPFGGVMVLGHNFDSEAGFDASVRRGREKLTGGTWGTLSRLLRDAAIPCEQCFFTNAFMGLCRGDDSLDYRGRRHAAFRSACRSFLREQIGVQRPCLILTLGLHVPPIMAELSPDLSAWIGPALHLSDIDAVPLVRSAGFAMADGSTHRATVVPIAHPSLPNRGRRRLRGYSTGGLGEIEAVMAGWRASGGSGQTVTAAALPYA
jgi:uracil-DNA glycosylase